VDQYSDYCLELNKNLEILELKQLSIVNRM
jgi:hypothetical protein